MHSVLAHAVYVQDCISMYDFAHVYTRGMKLSIIHVLKFNSWLVVCTNPMIRTWSLCCLYFDMNLHDSIMKTSNFWKKTKLILILCGLHMSSELTTTGHPLLGFMYIRVYFTPIIRNLKVRVLVLIQSFENTEVNTSELLMSFPSWVSPSWCKVTEVMGHTARASALSAGQVEVLPLLCIFL